MYIQPGPEPHYGISIALPLDALPQMTITCPGEDPTTGAWPIAGMSLVYTPTAEQTMQRGVYAGTSSFNGASYSWNLAGS